MDNLSAHHAQQVAQMIHHPGVPAASATGCICLRYHFWLQKLVCLCRLLRFYEIALGNEAGNHFKKVRHMCTLELLDELSITRSAGTMKKVPESKNAD